LHVRGAAAAAELHVQVDAVHRQPELRRMLLDVLTGTELARPDDLVLVEQEHRDPRSGHELVDLRSRRLTEVLGCPPADGGLTDPVGLVQDEHVQAVALGLHEVVEVLEQRPGVRRTVAGDLAQLSVEGARAVACTTVRPRRANSPS
jgi:hypothetical protein